MLKKLALFLIPLLLIVVAHKANADPPRQVPLLFNYQGALTDDGGNPIPDGVSNVKFRIFDDTGLLLYEEVQDLEVAKGNVSAIIGNGVLPDGAPTGGIPVSALDPTASRYLEVEVVGQRPYERMEVVTAPYALWADTALKLPKGAITGEMIGEGVITKEHLNAELLKAVLPDAFPNGLPRTLLPTDTLYSADFDTFKTVMVGSSGAAKIGIVPDFIHSSSQNVQGVLKDIDLAVKKKQEEVNTLRDETVKRIEAVDIKNLDRDGSEAMTGTLWLKGTPNPDNTTSDPSIQVKGPGWDVDSSGRLSATSANITNNLTAGTLTSSGLLKADSGDITNKLTVWNGADITGWATIKTGDLDVTVGNITVGGTVDTVDVSVFKFSYDTHTSETNTAAHTFSNISAKIADAQIPDEITRDTELTAHAALTATHGVASEIVGTNNAQTLTSKILVAPKIVSGTNNYIDPNLGIVPSVSAGANEGIAIQGNVMVTGDIKMLDAGGKDSNLKVDGVDISAHNHSGPHQGGSLTFGSNYTDGDPENPTILLQRGEFWGWSMISDSWFPGYKCQAIVTGVLEIIQQEGMDRLCVQSIYLPSSSQGPQPWPGGWTLRCAAMGGGADMGPTSCAQMVNDDFWLDSHENHGCRAGYIVICIKSY